MAARHVAWKLCRDRKVRCDGAQPRCQRCVRSGDECVYSLPSKQNKSDLAAMVEMLGERLEQAEAALSLQNSLHSTPSTFPHPVEPFAATTPPTTADAPDLDVFGLISPPDCAGIADFDFAGLEADLLGPLPVASPAEAPPCFQASLDAFDAGQLPAVLPSSAERAPQPLLLDEKAQNDLNRIYFHLVGPSFPVVDQAECDVRLDDPLVPLEMRALKLAVWAHAALRCRAYSHLVDAYYGLSRQCLERAELESPAASANVTALQAAVLIALLEFKKEIYNRAWLSANRALWLAQMLGLHRLDPCSLQPAAETNAAELGRCRRAFWAAFVLDMFIRIGARWCPRMTIEESEISTHLPDCLPGEPTTLGDALVLPATGKLRPSQGVVLAMHICGQCVCHVNHLNRERASKSVRYNFWAKHHSLADAIDNAREHALGHLKLSNAAADPMVLSTHAVLHASELCLCEAVYRKAMVVSAGSDLYADNLKRWMAAVASVVDVVHRMDLVDTNKLHPFTPWSIYVALQACVRQVQRDASTQGRSSSSGASSGADAPPTPPTHSQLLDWIHLLLSVLSSLKTTNPFARVFEAEIQTEIRQGAGFMQDRIVGFVDFPVAVKRSGFDQYLL